MALGSNEGGTGFLEMIMNSTLGSYVIFIILAIWGGTVNYVSKHKPTPANSQGEHKFKVAELLGEWFISGFAGLLVALICIELKLSLEVTAACAGVAGHMGGRMLFVLELFVRSRLGVPLVDPKPPAPPAPTTTTTTPTTTTTTDKTDKK